MALPNMSELGTTGLRRQGGVIYEEYLRELQGPRWFKVVREMANDAVIGGVLLAIELSLRQVSTKFEPADDTPAAAEIAEFFDGALHDMSSSWADNLSEILTMLSYGWEYNELVYKRRMGDNKDAGKSSKFNDGRIGWRKWAIRGQDSLYEWAFDGEGGLQGMWQVQDGGKPYVMIPIDKALLFRTSTHKGNPEGHSILRSAYSAYYYKKNLSRIEAIGLERGTGGIPIAYVPAQILSKNADADSQALYATIKEIVTNVRRDEQEGIVFPLMYDEQNNKMFEFDLLTTDKAGGVNTDVAISRYNQQITMSMLADFIMLGHEKVGSYALSATKSSLFKTALEAWLQAIADVINTHAVPRLMRLNGDPIELAPKLAFGKVGEVELADIVSFVKEAALAGMQLFPGMELENHLRNIVGFPPLSEEEFAQREEERKAQEEADRQIQRDAITSRQQGGKDEKMSSDEVRAQLEAALKIVARGA